MLFVSVKVEELNVDSCKATSIAGITDEFVNLQTLSMTNNELTSLKGFPKLPNLRKVRRGNCVLISVLCRCSILMFRTVVCSEKVEKQ